MSLSAGCVAGPSFIAGSTVPTWLPKTLCLQITDEADVAIASVPFIRVLTHLHCCMQIFGLPKPIDWPPAEAQQPAAVAGIVGMFWLGTVCTCCAGGSSPLHLLLGSGA